MDKVPSTCTLHLFADRIWQNGFLSFASMPMTSNCGAALFALSIYARMAGDFITATECSAPLLNLHGETTPVRTTGRCYQWEPDKHFCPPKKKMYDQTNPKNVLFLYSNALCHQTSAQLALSSVNQREEWEEVNWTVPRISWNLLCGCHGCTPSETHLQIGAWLACWMFAVSD